MSPATRKSSAVAVQIHRDSDTVFLKIEDKGPGFIPSNFFESSGISGMRERATLLGGTLTVQSRPGGGTQIQACLPVGEVPGAAG